MPQSKEYRDYIQSAKWRAMAREAKVATGGRCQGCDRRTWTLHVHHLTYVRLGNEKASDLWVVCPPCHLNFHPHHKKAATKPRKGKPKIRRTRGIKKPRCRALTVKPTPRKGTRPWSPAERERFLAEAEALLQAKRSR